MKRIIKKVEGWLVVSLLLIYAAVLGGCSFTGTQQALDISEKAVEKIPEDVGRFSAHVAVRTAEERTKQKLLEVKKAEAEAEKAAAQNTTITIDTNEKATAAALIEMARTMRDAVRALAKKDGAAEYGLVTTPTPKGAIAETIDSSGQAVERVAQTPTAVASVVGYTVANVSRAAISGAGDRQTINGSDNQATMTKAKTTTATTANDDGQATGTASGGGSTVGRTFTESAVAEPAAVE